MSKIIKTLFLILCILTSHLHAQTSVRPFISTVEFDKAQRPCIQVNLDPEPKTLKKAWRDYLKDNYDFKINGIGLFSNKDILSAEGITINQISSKLMDFYTQIIENEDGSEMKLFVRFGYDIYVTQETYPSEYSAMNELLNGFIKYYIPKYYQKQIKDTEKAVKNLTNERDDLKKAIDKKSKEIEKLKKEIIEEEEEVVSNHKKLIETEEKLTSRKEKLERARNQIKNL